MFKKNSLNLNHKFLEELIEALRELKGWGSVEIYVQDGKVTQITERAIKKTNYSLEKDGA